MDTVKLEMYWFDSESIANALKERAILESEGYKLSVSLGGTESTTFVFTR